MVTQQSYWGHPRDAATKPTARGDDPPDIVEEDVLPSKGGQQGTQGIEPTHVGEVANSEVMDRFARAAETR